MEEGVVSLVVDPAKAFRQSPARGCLEVDHVSWLSTAHPQNIVRALSTPKNASLEQLRYTPPRQY